MSQNDEASPMAALKPGNVAQKPPRPSEYAKSPLITVFVGPDREEFNIYRDLLTCRSGFFKSALKDTWDHGNQIVLEKENPQAFAVLTDWMFSGKESLEEHYDTTSYELLASAYCLADFLLMPAVKNNIVDCIIQDSVKTGLYINFFGLLQICRGGAIGTKLFDLALQDCVALFMEGHAVGSDDEGWTDFPHALLAIIAKIDEWRQQTWKFAKVNDRCKWHEHDDGSKCE